MIIKPTPTPSLTFLANLKSGEFNDIVELLIIASSKLSEDLSASHPATSDNLLHWSEFLTSELEAYNSSLGAMKMVSAEKIRRHGESVLEVIYKLKNRALPVEAVAKPAKKK